MWEENLNRKIKGNRKEKTQKINRNKNEKGKKQTKKLLKRNTKTQPSESGGTFWKVPKTGGGREMGRQLIRASSFVDF